MKEALPNVKQIAPVVAWFADSLDISKCQILPRIEPRNESVWKVSKYDRSSAHPILYDQEGNIHYGGSIRDQNVVDFLSAAKEQGFYIIFYPLLMVDVARKPWRGHMTGKAEDVEAFYQNYYKPFIIHYANLVKDKVDAFIIGSELVGLTRIHTTGNIFPFVEKLIELAADVRAIMGSRVKLTYAADWSEYHTSDGMQRPLDSLWASKDIDFVGMN